LGPGSHGQAGGGIGFGLEQVAKSGAELAVENGAADPGQEIGAAAGPSHRLGLGHAAVDQDVGGAFGQRCADPQTGTMTFGVVGLSVTCVPKVPIWKALDFNGLRQAYSCNPMIS
jgi:hypothetical protein